jgi:NAD(P)-dependent dehydrogenase (short-subunit alcohol dehydrogenase family)
MDRGSVIVTGGTGGLGQAVVTRLIDDGWRTVVPWIVRAEQERMPERPGCDLVEADLFDPEAVADVVLRAGPDLRAVVNLVGGFDAPGRVHEVDIERFEAQFRLNLRPTYLVTQAALPRIVAGGGGAIVCVGTRAALQPFPGAAGYVASKAAVLAFVKALDVEYRDEGVRANAVLPSVIDTPFNRGAMPDADYSKWVTPAEIAAVISFLCSEDSKPTTGAWIPVHGRA